MSAVTAGAGWGMRRIQRIALASAMALVASSGSAQNLVVVNPEFDDAVEDLNWSGTSALWVAADDADGCDQGSSNSGSYSASAFADSGGPGVSIAEVIANDCVAVQAGQTVKTEISYRSPMDVGVGAFFYPMAGCNG